MEMNRLFVNDLIFLSSLYVSYSATIIEFFFADTPVLSCDVSAYYEHILENVNGWIVENCSVAITENLIEINRN